MLLVALMEYKLIRCRVLRVRRRTRGFLGRGEEKIVLAYNLALECKFMVGSGNAPEKLGVIYV